jgi:hypothetical protein
MQLERAVGKLGVRSERKSVGDSAEDVQMQVEAGGTRALSSVSFVKGLASRWLSESHVGPLRWQHSMMYGVVLQGSSVMGTRQSFFVQ